MADISTGEQYVGGLLDCGGKVTPESSNISSHIAGIGVMLLHVHRLFK